MALADLDDWLVEHSKPGIVWYVKRLSANDTLATGGHQAGPYIPKHLLFDVFPSLNREDEENPRKQFKVWIDSHCDERAVTAIWYNNKFRGGTRNETRLTNFGGSESALLDPDNTGSLTIFAFHLDAGGEANVCHIWVCETEIDAERVEDLIGPVDPGKIKVWHGGGRRGGGGGSSPPGPEMRTSCWLDEAEIPPMWLEKFPTGAEIISKVMELRPESGANPDKRLMKRRECEFELFRSVEEAVELPLIRQGFDSIDDFVDRAQVILQRRKARSGRSLELHARAIFIEEQLNEGTDFEHQPESDPGKRPDFLFPSGAAYKNAGFPKSRLRMLAVKTTCKDRWRQVLNEADRIGTKHLLTLQEGVSEGQFREMTDAGVKLVVPAPLLSSYPEVVRPYLQSLESFIGDVRLLGLE